MADDKSRIPGNLFKIPDLTDLTLAVPTDELVVVQQGSLKTAKKIATGELQTFGFSFVEAGDTSYTGTVEVPAGSLVHDIGFISTVLWDDGTSAVIDIGDDNDANGWFVALNLLATDLLVGEQLSISNAENWGGKQGVYLVAATGRKGRVTAGVDSGVYYGAASEIIFVVTTGGQDGTAGRSFGWVRMSTPIFTAAIAVA